MSITDEFVARLESANYALYDLEAFMDMYLPDDANKAAWEEVASHVHTARCYADPDLFDGVIRILEEEETADQTKAAGATLSLHAASGGDPGDDAPLEDAPSGGAAALSAGSTEHTE